MKSDPLSVFFMGNSAAREIAKGKWEDAKAELARLEAKPPSERNSKAIERAKRQIKHWKSKMDFTGKNHSQGGGKGPN